MVTANAVWRQENLDRLEENIAVAMKRLRSCSCAWWSEEYVAALREVTEANGALVRFKAEQSRRVAVS